MDSGYTRTAKAIHWAMAVTIIAVWFIGFYAANLRGDVPRGGLALTIHKAIASAVLFLIAGRLVYRLTARYPGLPAGITGRTAQAAKGVHLLLYGVMIAAPFSGWYWSSVAGHPGTILGLFKLPALVDTNLANEDVAMWVHRGVTWTAGILIVGHVIAALKHHLVDRDETLLRMLPGRKVIVESER